MNEFNFKQLDDIPHFIRLPDVAHPGIPKIFHFIWFGNLPDWAKYNISTFEKFNPSYEIKIHTDKSMLLEWMEPLYNRCTYEAQKSDLLRVSILQKDPGWYMDCDNRCFKPIDAVYDVIKVDRRVLLPGGLGFANGINDVCNNVMAAIAGASWANINGRYKYLAQHMPRKLKFAELGPTLLRECVDTQHLPPLMFSDFPIIITGNENLRSSELIVGHGFKS